MSFRDDRQRYATVHKLLASVDRQGLWTEGGPTDNARWVLSAPNHVPYGDWLVVRAAYDFWGGEPQGMVGLATLIAEAAPAPSAVAIAEALLAYLRGAAALDAWIAGPNRLSPCVPGLCHGWGTDECAGCGLVAPCARADCASCGRSPQWLQWAEERRAEKARRAEEACVRFASLPQPAAPAELGAPGPSDVHGDGAST